MFARLSSPGARCAPPILAIVLAMSSRAFAGGGSLSVDCSPKSGMAPLSVRVQGSAVSDCESYDWICVEIDFADGAPRRHCDYCFICDNCKAVIGIEIDDTYTFACPGTYTVHASVDPENCADCPAFSWQVEVAEPVLNLVAVSTPLETTCHLIAASSVDILHTVRSTVDWGDGSDVEEFSWIDHGDWAEGPAHDFGRNGYFTVRVANEIAGTGCNWTQTAAVIANPGYTTPVSLTTWGKVKALYAK